MGNRNGSVLLSLIAGADLSAPTFAAAQNQTPAQPRHNTSTLHFEPVANPRALCSPNEGKPVTTKERLLALPANLIDPPKTPEGWPDLQGSWSSATYPGSARSSLEQGVDPLDQAVQCQPLEKLDTYRVNLMIDPMKGRIPYQPWAKAKQMEFLAGEYAPQRRMMMPDVACFELSVAPRSVMYGFVELRYAPGAVVIFQGSGRAGKGTRIIPVDTTPMDTTPHLSQDVMLFTGDSRGHWEGNTLVVETTNSREGSNWFDSRGTFHSEAMRTIERFTLVNDGTLYYEATIIDPTVFTQTWKMSQTFERQKGSRVADPQAHEDECHEYDTSAERYVRAGLRAKSGGPFRLPADHQSRHGQGGRPRGSEVSRRIAPTVGV